MVASGAILSNRFLLLNETGAGGMGVVYEATDLKTGAQVAIKVLHALYARDPQYISRLQREAQIAASIRSPRVVRVIDIEQHDGAPYLVMEYVDGENLSDRIQRDGPLPVSDAVSIAIEIARAIEAAHAVGVLHRDLKPSNVKITTESEIKVLDFGIARAAGLPSITGTGIFTGTPEYCAPERFDGEGDIRADIYSLGIVLYEMLSGAPPFTGPSPWAVLRGHETQRPPPLLLSAPVEMQRILDRTLAKRPGDRYQSPGELMAALVAARQACWSAEWRDDHRSVASMGPVTVQLPAIILPSQESGPTTPLPTSPVGPPTPDPGTPRIRRGLVLRTLALGSVAALAIAAGVMFASTRDRKPTPPTPIPPTETPVTAAVSITPSTPSPLLQAGERRLLNLSGEVLLSDCAGPDRQPRIKALIQVTEIESEYPDLLYVSYRISVPLVSDVPESSCPIRFAPDVGGDNPNAQVETIKQSGNVISVLPAGGGGLAITGAEQIYGKSFTGKWLFRGVDLFGSELHLIYIPFQQLSPTEVEAQELLRLVLIRR